MNDFGLVVPENFIQATRDSGYKSLGSALAELVDNAFESKAKNVAIEIERCEGQNADVRVRVIDDGHGMDRFTLRHALQFGWSSRFNNRDSHGRYGMGLPNASLSHARRVELVSLREGQALRTHLDVDEIADRAANSIPNVHRVSAVDLNLPRQFNQGTIVTWQKCDRLLNRKLGPLSRKVRLELGRLFRYQLWAKKTISVNGERATAFDPLFILPGSNLSGASPHGPELLYPIELPSGPRKRISTVTVRFAQLPIRSWHSLTNEEKNAHGIAKKAGVSIVRAGREIDYGWFFMGQKRKENYDDWWRCEVRFEPDLDEWFGVTHTKQEIHPTDELLSILTPDLERIARDLNSNTRRAFTEVKAHTHRRKSETQAERFDNLLEPPIARRVKSDQRLSQNRVRGRRRVRGLQYHLRFDCLKDDCFFQPTLKGTQVMITLNEAHPFVREVWRANSESCRPESDGQRQIELLLFAAARSELSPRMRNIRGELLQVFRRTWSKTLATFLS